MTGEADPTAGGFPEGNTVITSCIMRSNAAIIETGQNKGGAVPGHTAANSVKHSSWKHGEGVYPASRSW